MKGTTTTNDEQKVNQVTGGDLSADAERARQIAMDEQTAVAMQRQMTEHMMTASVPLGRLTLTVVEVS